jgi:circadian clock protein KaiC
MADSELIPVGIAGFDRILLGGIRRGNVILVEGLAGAGKSLFGVEFIYRGATQFNEPGIIVVFESNPDLVRRDAAGFGWDLGALEAQNRVKIISTSPQVLEQELSSPDSLLLQTAVEMGARRIFIDSVSLLRSKGSNGGSAGNEPDTYRELLQQLIEGLRRENLTAMLAHEVGSQSELSASLEIAEFLADTVIHLKRRRSDFATRRSIEVIKSRGQGFDEGDHTMKIVGGEGIKIYRRVQAVLRDQVPQPTSLEKRSAIGAEPLDALTGGGLFEGSVTMIVGVSGAGKSLLGYQVLVEGARKLGKKGLLITMDEHPAQVMRNAAVLGLGLREQVESGMIFIMSESPLELEVDVHFDRILRLVEEHEIDRVVVDGVTTAANAIGNERPYREFIHALLAFTKGRLMTTFLCYENPELFGITRFMPEQNISSIVDNIIMLSFVELGDRLHRAMTVAKARGCGHSMMTREYDIGEGGLTLLPGKSRLQTEQFGDYYGLVSRAPTRFIRNLQEPDEAKPRRKRGAENKFKKEE